MRVVVIGGGIMGCSVGWRLAQGGAEVTIVERAVPGAEASSAAAGMLAPQMEAERPGPFLELCLRSRGTYPAFAAELQELTGVDVQYVPSGILKLAFDEAGAQELSERVAWQQAVGLRAALLDGPGARALEPGVSDRVVCAAHFPDDHQVDNQLLMRALTMAAARAGATFRTGVVRGVLEEKGRAAGVDVEGERMEADAVVVAAGSWSGLVPGAGISPSTVKPARGQMVQFQLRLPPFRSMLSSPQGYLVPRRDGRVIAGSTLEFKGFDKAVTAEGLRRLLDMALTVFPALADAPVQAHWAGLRPWTEDHAPLLGEGSLPGLHLATGHFRNGILLAPITARLVADALLG
ncbi:MAG: glycine oxidase ThiO, partial [Deltaproteobacteria bacterium]|nr:glycine oxidase ThiO [Deltaproteobacteria bacterium]